MDNQTAPSETTVAPTSTAKPLTNPIYQQSEFVCSCNRMLSRLEYVKKNGVFTGEVICKCPGGAACPNGNKKIRVKSIQVEAEEI